MVWLSDAEIDVATHEAPDLWNWREAVFSFTPPVRPASPALPAGAPSVESLAADAAEVAGRLQQIERYLAGEDADLGAAAHLWLEAAQIYRRLGRWDESEHACRQAAAGFAEAGNAAGAAAAQAERAELGRLRDDP